MVEPQNPKEIDNPELTLDPNKVGQKVEQSTQSVQVALDPTVSIQNDLDDLISNTITDSATKQKIDFTTNKADATKKEDAKLSRLKEKKIPTLIFIYVFFVLLGGGILYCLVLFNVFLWFQRTWNVPSALAKNMPWVERQYEKVLRKSKIQPIDKYSPTQVVTTDPSRNNIIWSIVDDSEIWYITKKKVLQGGVSLLYNDAIARYDTYESLKNTIWQQWFFPKSIQSIDSESFNNSIQRAIVSVESIKFAVALKYFSLLDSFITQLSSYASMNKDVVREKLKMFVWRWEKDINLYVNACYMNAYELSSTCSSIWDFFNYYNYIDSSFSDQDKRLFILTMDLIESKLENADYPSLDISVTNIDPKENSINIAVEINTFKEDELQLTLTNWILNPHIYLTTSVVNHLRESRFVLTDTININQLNVNSRRVRIGWQTVMVNTSNFDFALPLQNSVEREIYDFSDIFSSVIE